MHVLTVRASCTQLVLQTKKFRVLQSKSFAPVLLRFLDSSSVTQDLKVVSTDQRVDLQSIVNPDARTTSSVSLRFRYLCNLVLPVSPGSPNACKPSWSKTGRRKINHVLGFPCWPSVWHCVSPNHGDCFFGDLAGP